MAKPKVPLCIVLMGRNRRVVAIEPAEYLAPWHVQYVARYERRYFRLVGARFINGQHVCVFTERSKAAYRRYLKEIGVG